MKLNLKKCCLFKGEVKFESETLICYLGHYQTYIQDFSIKLKPVNDLLQGKTKSNAKVDSWLKIQWKPEHQAVIKEMVSHLKSPAVISYPDFGLPLLIYCDGSWKGLGAVLYKEVGKKLKVVSFASSTLSPAERN